MAVDFESDSESVSASETLFQGTEIGDQESVGGWQLAGSVVRTRNIGYKTNREHR